MILENKNVENIGWKESNTTDKKFELNNGVTQTLLITL
jgi:hypothetical protein